MTHEICRVTEFEITGPYTLDVTFDDGTARTIDFKPVLAGELYGPLRDLGLFDGVQLDREVGTLVWPNGADFDPATLRAWPDVVHELELMARRWEEDERKRGTG